MIGNPPYGGTKIDDNVRLPLGIDSKDPYGAFIARFLAAGNKTTPLKHGGVLAYIVSDTFMTIVSHHKLRRQMMDNYIHKMIRVHPDTFRATVNTVIMICERNVFPKDDSGNYRIVNNFDPNHICQMTDMTNISIHDNFDHFVEVLRQTEGVDFDARNLPANISNPEYAVYYYPQNLIKTNSNLPFFVASPKLFALMNDGNDNNNKPSTQLATFQEKQIKVRTFIINEKEVQVVKLGDIADVKVGLQTGDNHAYLYQNPEARGTYRSIEDYKAYLLTDADLEKIRDNEHLRLAVIDKGINTDNPYSECYFEGKYIIPYDKGGESDAEGGWMPNYFVPTNYFIDWSEWAVHRMKTLTTKEKNKLENIGGGDNKLCSRFQNVDTYFQKYVSYSRTGIYAPTFRLGTPSPYDNKSCGVFPPKYIFNEVLFLLNSKFIKYIFKNILGHTIDAQVDDVKELCFSLAFKSISSFENIIEKQKLNARYDYASYEQIEIDRLVYAAYGLVASDVQEIEDWYARRYPKLSAAQKANLKALGKSEDYLELYGLK